MFLKCIENCTWFRVNVIWSYDLEASRDWDKESAVLLVRFEVKAGEVWPRSLYYMITADSCASHAIKNDTAMMQVFTFELWLINVYASEILDNIHSFIRWPKTDFLHIYRLLERRSSRQTCSYTATLLETEPIDVRNIFTLDCSTCRVSTIVVFNESITWWTNSSALIADLMSWCADIPRVIAFMQVKLMIASNCW